MLGVGLFQGFISKLDLSLRTCKSRSVGLFLPTDPDTFAHAVQLYLMISQNHLAF
jgi:hypothetical protein